MKKSVIILIGIIYAAAITVVTFYGLETAKYVDQIVPIESIMIKNENAVRKGDTFEWTLLLKPQDTVSGKFKVEYEIGPADATNKNVKLTLVIDSDKDGVPYASVDEDGIITVSPSTPLNLPAKLYIYPGSDGSGGTETDSSRVHTVLTIIFNCTLGN